MAADTFPLEELRLLLKEAQAADAGLKEFGAQRHKYQWRPPASLGDVEKFEHEIGTALPEDYRDFLLQAGDGGAGPYFGLFSLEDVHNALEWPIEPGRAPRITPGLKEWSSGAPDNWKRGCIPIGYQGDTFFIHLMVAGPDRGRVFYMEYEGGWIFFPREQTFLSWYTRWLREVRNGYHIFWFGTNLDGDEAELRWHYAQASAEDERQLAITSMEKFPTLSEETKAFLADAINERVTIPDAKIFLELAYRAAPEFYHQFLDMRWEAGLYGPVLRELNFSLYHIPIERTVLARRWRERILARLPELPQEVYESALELLVQCGDVKLDQAVFLLDRAEDGVKREILSQFRRFFDAGENIRLWLPLLRQREDLELLSAALATVPRTGDEQLRKILMEIQTDFSFVAEQLQSFDYKDRDARNRRTERQQEHEIYNLVCSAWQDAFHEAINPAVAGSPRPYRLEMHYCDIQDLRMNRLPPPDGIPIHPLVALAMLGERGRLPSTAYDWKRELERIKRLRLCLNQNTVRAWDEKERRAVLRCPEIHCPPPPYYYDLHNWSAVGRMPNLRSLIIAELCVDDFSFLTQCKNIQTLSLYNTNFTDCRLLLEMPKLKTVDLRLCRLTHKEALDNLSLDCQL